MLLLKQNKNSPLYKEERGSKVGEMKIDLRTGLKCTVEKWCNNSRALNQTWQAERLRATVVNMSLEFFSSLLYSVTFARESSWTLSGSMFFCRV